MLYLPTDADYENFKKQFEDTPDNFTVYPETAAITTKEMYNSAVETLQQFSQPWTAIKKTTQMEILLHLHVQKNWIQCYCQ